MIRLRRALALFSLCVAVLGCAPKPPVLPYLAISEYSDGECAYDWNGAAIDLTSVPEVSRRWKGSRDVLFVFYVDAVPERCVEQARKVIPSLGFSRTYDISVPERHPGDPPLIP